MPRERSLPIATDSIEHGSILSRGSVEFHRVPNSGSQFEYTDAASCVSSSFDVLKSLCMRWPVIDRQIAIGTSKSTDGNVESKRQVFREWST